MNGMESSQMNLYTKAFDSTFKPGLLETGLAWVFGFRIVACEIDCLDSRLKLDLSLCLAFKMTWHSPKEAMPWVGLYVAIASFICTLAMAADVFQGFRQRKLWFPCSFFTLNATSITLIAIAMKLPVDLSDDPENDWIMKSISMVFFFTMLANFLPSLASMDDRELFANMIALGILIITIIVNMCYQLAAMNYLLTYSLVEVSVMGFFPIWLFWVALTVPTSRRVLDHQYKELHKLALNCEKIKFSSKELIHHVKRYWMMAETGNPQFVLASSPFLFCYRVDKLTICCCINY
ncbi:hypothetical protein OSB04_013935 [Centaurea solstitialis]|uniref:Uncharacterized protein n=1 Tax=Centaurea solstitialis TaxID=347529 RepID=A0AA38TS35_9ASTR|nr:hypothetical protein OSB04_013935 [Centaurea solstitialis]